jgi:hypothetical protein
MSAIKIKVPDQRVIVLFQGLPGSGKTTLADKLADILPYSVRINADMIRGWISKDLGFSVRDRIVQAYRMGAISSLAVSPPYGYLNLAGHPTNGEGLNRFALVDFVNPTEQTDNAFRLGAGSFFGSTRAVIIYKVWMNTITPKESRFADTSKMYTAPASHVDIEVKNYKNEEQFQTIAETLSKRLLDLGPDTPVTREVL